jgi:polysaccharide pyruvyl transferase WcaK-like protein
MDTILRYLRRDHPDAAIDAMSGGFERIRSRYEIAAVPLSWFEQFEQGKSGIAAIPLRVFGKVLDLARIMAWVRRHDLVIVPGAGILEATLPMRAYGFPFSMFLLGVSGRLFRTKVALVSVGANAINKPATRWLSNATARLAHYRSYRDVHSINAMRDRGIDVSGDRVFPDLVFGVPTPPYNPGDPQLVGVGVMAYYGGNDDGARADDIHASYMATMTSFVQWLVDNGYRVRLFGGDNKFDDAIAQQILGRVRAERPDMEPSMRVVADPIASYPKLMDEMNGVGTVVATRYHNVMGALKLCKPTIALGYSQKFVALMESMGLGDYVQFAYELDIDQLIRMFKEMQTRRSQLQETMMERNAANARGLAEQFALMSSLLFPAARASRALPEPEQVRS